MRLKDIRFGTQLSLGLGINLLLVGLLVGFSCIQSELLWRQTRDLYEHPLTVRRALGELRADVLGMQMGLKDLCLTENEKDFTEIVHDIEVSESDALRQIAVLSDRYLGPRNDVLQVRLDLERWDPLRDETIRLLRAGKRAEATARTVALGDDGKQAAALLADIHVVSDFAQRKGDQLYSDARRLNDILSYVLIGAIFLVFLICVGIVAVLIRAVGTPLRELIGATAQFRHGKLDARVNYISKNEFGTLAQSFNTMADAMQKEMTAKESAALLASAMLQDDEAHGFCRELLKALMTHTDSQMGAVYLLNEGKTEFVHFESIGLDEQARAVFPVASMAGELGAAVATQKIRRITDIPPDTRFTFTAVSGRLLPREILTIPVLFRDEVSAVVSLASVRAYSEAAVRLVDDVWSVLVARMNSVLASQRIRDLAARLEAQNHELDTQKRELAAQTSELVEQNAELELQKRQIGEANRLKSQFVSNMSHELRTPLNSVIALSSVLHRRLAGKIPVEEYGYLEVIERNGKNLLELINDILDLSRIEAGREEIRVQAFAVSELVEELVPALTPLARDKGLALENRVAPNLPPLTSDSVKVRHILQNLLSNAIKFTEKGHVAIDAVAVGSTLDFMVSDTGIGIAADKQEVIFHEFRQADESTSRKYGGSGLGLSIARKYARMLGGDLFVKSALGQGATFTLSLPLVTRGETKPRAPTPLPRSSPHKARKGNGQCILVVEDSEPAAVQIADILSTDGYRVEVARNGRAALEFLGRELPSAVVLDLMMPEVDGFQVLREMRASSRTLEVPVLILTARQVSREELSVLTGNHIHQLVQKGDVDKAGLLSAIAEMVAPTALAPPAPKRRRRRRARNGRPVVLVVEDNLDNMRTMKALLEPRYQVIEACDGKSGFEEARRNVPDVILMDIALPEVDGIQSLGLIRRDESVRDIPVLAVTASAMADEREKIMASDFDGYISKPVEYEVLMKVMDDVLARDGGS